MNDYFDSIRTSLEDLQKAEVPAHVWRDIDRELAAIRDLYVEYRVPARGKTLLEVFAQEQRGANQEAIAFKAFAICEGKDFVCGKG